MQSNDFYSSARKVMEQEEAYRIMCAEQYEEGLEEAKDLLLAEIAAEEAMLDDEAERQYRLSQLHRHADHLSRADLAEFFQNMYGL